MCAIQRKGDNKARKRARDRQKITETHYIDREEEREQERVSEIKRSTYYQNKRKKT